MLSRFAALLNEKKKRISQLDAAATRHAAITGALQSVASPCAEASGRNV